MTVILGISAYYHDSAAALVVDGDIVAAAQEERFTRIKHDSSYPKNAIDYVLSEIDTSGNSVMSVDFVVFYDKPFLKFKRLIMTYLAYAPSGFSQFERVIPDWLGGKFFLKNRILRELKKKNINVSTNSLLFCEHHYSHAASAFYPSPFKEAVVITIDGAGEMATTTVAIGYGSNLNVIKEIHFPHSLGLLYSAFTFYIGFRVNSGEYKLMGLAPYGKPKYKELILNKLLDVKEDGSFRLDQSYFNYATGFTMISDKFIKLFGMPIRKADKDTLTQFHMDIAASVQAVIEFILLKMTKSLAKEFKGIQNLCMAGGVALNCVANGKILRSNSFKNIWIQPASGDAGGALGAALAVWYRKLGKARTITGNDNAIDAMKGSYLGPDYSQEVIENRLTSCGAKYVSVDEKDMLEHAVDSLIDGKVVGWFQGKMEFGPRALGGRSILGDPRSKIMQKVLNLKIKYRESFRPFAPSVLNEDAAKWFDLDSDSPYMLLVGKVNDSKCYKMTDEENNLFGIEKLNKLRSRIPSVTHVDYSARIQTVYKSTNPKYYALISKFKEKTGVPMIVNTSFNVRGEPIVCTPEDAFKCFMGTDMDLLILGNCILKKEDQNTHLLESYKDKYDKD